MNENRRVKTCDIHELVTQVQRSLGRGQRYLDFCLFFLYLHIFTWISQALLNLLDTALLVIHTVSFEEQEISCNRASLKMKNDHRTVIINLLLSTTAVQMWIISYILHVRALLNQVSWSLISSYVTFTICSLYRFQPVLQLQTGPSGVWNLFGLLYSFDSIAVNSDQTKLLLI